MVSIKMQCPILNFCWVFALTVLLAMKTWQAWDLAKLQWTHPFWSYRSYNALALLGSISIILFSGSNNQGLGCYGKLETGSLAVTYTHNEDHGALALAGMQDAQLNPILLWSTNYNIVHLYELPSFAERGKISFEAEVGAVKNGPGGLIFTSDEIGKLKLWKWTAERTSGVSNWWACVFRMEEQVRKAVFLNRETFGSQFALAISRIPYSVVEEYTSTGLEELFADVGTWKKQN